MSLSRASLLGGVDGVITSFAIVAGTHAGGIASRGLLVIGISSLLADGLSMGVSEYLSSATARAKGEHLSNADDASPVQLGLACFLCFVLCGMFPTMAYVAFSANIAAVICVTLLELLCLGGARAYLSHQKVWRGILETVGLGASAGAVAYAVGYIINELTSNYYDQ